MAKVKAFSDFEHQLYILSSEKNIIIQDADFAKNTLERIGYFPLIGGYKHLFRIPYAYRLMIRVMIPSATSKLSLILVATNPTWSRFTGSDVVLQKWATALTPMESRIK